MELDIEIKNSIMFKITSKGLKRLSKKQVERFFDGNNIFSKPVRDNKMYLSLTYEEKDNNIGVFLWHKQYSLGVTYDEFMAVYETIKNKEMIINEIVANRI